MSGRKKSVSRENLSKGSHQESFVSWSTTLNTFYSHSPYLRVRRNTTWEPHTWGQRVHNIGETVSLCLLTVTLQLTHLVLLALYAVDVVLFKLVLSGDVSSHRVVSREGSRAVGTGNADTLMALPDVSSQVCLVAIESFAEWTL